MKLKTTLLLVLIATFAAGPILAQSLKGSRPNIILVMTDDQGMGDLSSVASMGSSEQATNTVAWFKGKVSIVDLMVQGDDGSPRCFYLALF